MANNLEHNGEVVEETSHEVTIYAEPIFHVGNFAITNSLFTTWLAVLLIAIFSLVIRLNLKKVPGKLQNIFEVMLEGAMSLTDQVTNDRKITNKIFPLVFSLFVFILINNWIGLLPFISAIGFTVVESGQNVFVPLFRAGTADINTTLALSLMIIVASNLFGILTIGLWKLFNKYVNLKALGEIFTKFKKDKTVVIVSPISVFVGLLELIGEMAKIASLSFRLFGNVFAGEVLLASMSAIFLYILPGPFLFLEVFIGLIQALIFSLLGAVYFTIAAQDHNEHEEYETVRALDSHESLKLSP
ncbi:MAG: ATP synthase subunit a [Candidatus Nomurabacteria bacterium GW2011_GWA2_40_9]|uniref:ATP synthase subunit a n=1 Tax=Candidatus Nomurabacteria bacterium GW2011_GWA2_40_9 TaxID=1618734 RepID=A0A0G0WWT4_9BACT|nr:MAG: ATP synthase subunit a [Candidatus Nomurabacteria bacterium GW2011_GWA2_40_9]